MRYLLLFLEGIITFISPCLLPMLPIYISYFAAGESDKRRTFINSLGFVMGFTLIFITLGAFAGTVGQILRHYDIIVNLVTGLIVIALGLNFIGFIRIGFLNRTRIRTAHVYDLSFFSSMLFGMAFSIGWTPCVSAFLGSALMMASRQGGTFEGIFMLLAYSLGLGIPFIISAILIDRLKSTFQMIKTHYRIINIVSGTLLIIVGFFMATGLMGRFLSILTF